MHRTRHVLKLGAWGLLTAGLIAGVTTAQTPASNQFQQIINQQPPAAEQPPPPPPQANRAPAGKAVVIAINGSAKLSMSTKKAIRVVENEKETVARVQATPNPSEVIVVGLQAGSSRIKMTDVDGVVESYDVLVQLDIDAIKSVIKLTFPTANVIPIAAGSSAIVLTGNVAHPEDIEPILRVARGVLSQAGAGASEVYNAMTVGGVRQVQLDVTIAQVNRSEARNRNLNFIINGSTVSAGSITPPSLLQAPQAQNLLSGGSGVGITPFTYPASPNTGSNLVFGIVPANFNVLMQALRTENLAKLLAEPKLITMSGHPATFLSGGQQAVIGPTSGITGPGVVYQDTGTALTFLPIVLNNGKIFLEVEPIVRSVDNSLGITLAGSFTPGFSVQRVQTRVTMEAGQTFAIGGLIQTATQATANKVPFFGDLPFVGTIFSSITHTEQEQEMIVLVTPFLIDPMDCKQAPCKLPGMETRKPDDFELYLETILEAPRGQRDVFPGKHYKAAYKNDPTADKFPCGGDRGGNCDGGCNNGACNTGGCNNCGGTVPVPVPAPTQMPK